MIELEKLDQVFALVDEQGLSEQTIALLRQQFAGCHFTWCMDDDVIYPKAYAERPGYKVYLVDSRDHCSTLTYEPTVASGVVLAEVIGD
jgi:hypothetical protein